MKPTVYIETTIVSHLTARPTDDPLITGEMQATRKWWDHTRQDYEVFTSALVNQESARGDPEAAAARLNLLSTLPSVPITDGAQALANALVASHALPTKARVDALHVAIAATNGIHYLLTWNCRHLANVTLRARIEQTCREQGFEPPLICTPLELTEV